MLACTVIEANTELGNHCQMTPIESTSTEIQCQENVYADEIHHENEHIKNMRDTNTCLKKRPRFWYCFISDRYSSTTTVRSILICTANAHWSAPCNCNLKFQSWILQLPVEINGKPELEPSRKNHQQHCYNSTLAIQKQKRKWSSDQGSYRIFQFCCWWTQCTSESNL